MGLIGLVLALPALLYPFKVHPEDEGLLPYGYHHHENKEKQINHNTKFNITNLYFIIFLIFAILLTAITGMPSHFPGFGESIGVGATVGSLMLSACMIGNISSKLIIGILSDLLGVVKAVVIMILINSMAMVTMLMIKSDLALIVLAILFGSVYSISAVGIALLTKYFFGEDNYPKAFSIVSFTTNLGAAFAMTLIGFIFDIFNSYSNAFIIMIGFNVVNLLLLYILVKHKGEKKNVKE